MDGRAATDPAELKRARRREQLARSQRACRARRKAEEAENAELRDEIEELRRVRARLEEDVAELEHELKASASASASADPDFDRDAELAALAVARAATQDAMRRHDEIIAAMRALASVAHAASLRPMPDPRQRWVALARDAVGESSWTCMRYLDASRSFRVALDTRRGEGGGMVLSIGYDPIAHVGVVRMDWTLPGSVSEHDLRAKLDTFLALGRGSAPDQTLSSRWGISTAPVPDLSFHDSATELRTVVHGDAHGRSWKDVTRIAREERVADTLQRRSSRRGGSSSAHPAPRGVRRCWTATIASVLGDEPGAEMPAIQSPRRQWTVWNEDAGDGMGPETRVVLVAAVPTSPPGGARAAVSLSGEVSPELLSVFRG